MIEQLDHQAGVGTAFAVRCHAGTLRIGDELTVGVDPQGGSHRISLRCVKIRLAPSLSVSHLDTNFGGAVVLEGPEVDRLDTDWTLRFD